MNPARRWPFVAASCLCLAGLVLATSAQDLPPIPSKTLPSAQAPSAAALAAPSRYSLSMRLVPSRKAPGRAFKAVQDAEEHIDSDADEAAEIARERVARKMAPHMAARKAAAPKAAAPNAVAPAAVPANIPDDEFFMGTDRKAAKLSVADAPMEPEFTDLAVFLKTLPSKEDMVNHTPKITKNADSGRVAEENRNVRIRCWLYAASRERDNDFHLILGREPGQPKQFMTMEVSGLPDPDADSFPQLFAARKSFNDFFGNQRPGRKFDFYDPPIPVAVEGSPFFDITHARGTPPGPAALRPDMPVIWEIHPITKLEFEPGT